MAKAGNSQIMRTITLLITIFSLSLPAYAQYSGGTGEPDDPYQIATAEDLLLLGETLEDYDKHFILTADIDLDPNLPGRKIFDRAVIAWDSYSTGFAGIFDGNDHTISHLTITGVSSLGLFGLLDSGATISNLGLEAVDVNGTGGDIGGLVGTNSGNITTCFSTGSVIGNEHVGGLVGTNSGSIVTSYSSGSVSLSSTLFGPPWGPEGCFGGLVGYNDGSIAMSYSNGMVNGPVRVGGLVGCNFEGWGTSGNICASYSTSTVSKIGTWSYGGVGGLVGSNGGDIISGYSTGTVIGDSYVGGLVGCNYVVQFSMTYADTFQGRISTSYSTGTVIGQDFVGGLVGKNNDGGIDMSYSTGNVSGDLYVGGLVGSNDGSISTCYNTSIVTGNDYIGGLVGLNRYAGKISMSYCNGSVIGNDSVGGLVGENGWHGNIEKSYSTGTVTGSQNVGGLVGSNVDWGAIDTSYSTGNVSGDLHVGGLVGNNSFKFYGNPHRGSIISSFWDIETSDQLTSDGGTPKTTAEMQTASTFLEAGWDFVDETVNGPNDIWKIAEGLGYPRLWWEKYGGGTGEPYDPYRIYTTEHLNEMGAEPNDYDKHFKLMADIDLAGYMYDRAVIAPDVGGDGYSFPGTPFTGVFDGNGRVVSHLTITGKSYLGLFGQLGSGAEVKDLGVVDVNITGSYYAIGGLVGNNFRGSITTSYSTGTVTGYTYVGGLVGYNKYGDIATSYSTAAVRATFSGNQKIGGLVGVNAGRTTTSYSTGTVSGERIVGGLVGQTTDLIAMCYSTGKVSGNDYVGGLVGYNYDSSVLYSFWDIETSGLVNSDGGIGKSTAEMQTASTFLEADWDFVDETANGTEDIWWILEGQDYPRLWWEDSN